MDTFDCYACGAAVTERSDACDACDAAQTREAYDAHRERRRLGAVIEQWKVIAIALLVVGAAGGAAAGYWLSGAHTTPVFAPHAIAEELPEHVAREHLTDRFMRRMNESFENEGAPIGFLSWVPIEGGGIAIEMVAPTRETPVTLWQALDVSERTALTQHVAVAYETSLLRANIGVDLRQGHVPLVLQYRGMRNPLATRRPDGAIELHANPYDEHVSPGAREEG